MAAPSNAMHGMIDVDVGTRFRLADSLARENVLVTRSNIRKDISIQ